MVTELQQLIAAAALSGAGCDVIEKWIIDPVQLDKEQKSALWLYAHALTERRSEAMLSGSELVLPADPDRGERGSRTAPFVRSPTIRSRVIRPMSTRSRAAVRRSDRPESV